MADLRNSDKVVFLTSGGTGGHIFPAECLADKLKSDNYEVFLITDKRYRNFIGNEKSYEICKISTATISKNPVSIIIAAIKILKGIYQSYRIMKCHKSAPIVGFGGYPAFPALVAGILAGRKTIIHEQNSVLGLANRLLARFVRTIATSFSAVKKIPDSCKKKVIYTGNPVRKSIADIGKTQYPKLTAKSEFRILVVGGSLGAQVFSRIVPAAIESLPEKIRSRLKITQQCRLEDINDVGAKYRYAGVQAELSSFIKDLPAKLENTHLVISRAGASTIAELLTAGRPVILVPYPNSKDDHQLHNAKELENIGGGFIVQQQDFTPESLASLLQKFCNTPKKLNSAAKSIKLAEFYHAEATENLAKLVVKP